MEVRHDDSFAFDDVPPGRYVLLLEGGEPEKGEPVQVPVEVLPGREVQVVLSR